MSKPVYQPEKIHSIMLKLSGEVLAGSKGFGFDDAVVDQLTSEIIAIKRQGYSLGIVIGGGNIFRGGKWKNQSLDRVTLDNIGMLATIQNALYLAEILKNKKVNSCYLIGMWINLTKYPMNPITKNPTTVACAISLYSEKCRIKPKSDADPEASYCTFHVWLRTLLQ